MKHIILVILAILVSSPVLRVHAQTGRAISLTLNDATWEITNKDSAGNPAPIFLVAAPKMRLALNIPDTSQVVTRTTGDALYLKIADLPAAPNLAPYLTTAVANTTFVPLTQRGVVNGVATLDASGKVPIAQLPPYPDISGLLSRSEAASTYLKIGDLPANLDLAPYLTISAANATFAPLLHNHDTVYIPLTQRGTSGGVATLGTDGRVPASQLPPASGGAPVPTKKVFVIIVPWGLLADGYPITDIKLKAYDKNGNLVYFYISTDPQRWTFYDQIYRQRPIVRFTSTHDKNKNDRWQVQDNTPIFDITGGKAVGGFVIEINADEAPDDAEWVYSLYGLAGPLSVYSMPDNIPVYFPIVPIDKF